jgi:2-haloacid dehalogenase
VTPFDLDRFEALTFDCYGTLVDWEAGIVTAARRLLGEGAVGVDDETLLRDFGRFEPAAQAGPFRSYRDVLREVAGAYGRARGVAVSDTAADLFSSSVPDWPIFDDSTAALRRLGRRFRLGIVSNVDDDLFAGSAERLGVDFDEVVTAQQVRSYKPARAHFDEMLRRLDLPRERVLHVAQSLYHDVAPARALGFTCVWVDRRSGRSGGGATPPSDAKPDFVVPDLATLANTSRA